jgi:hypothetical protein
MSFNSTNVAPLHQPIQTLCNDRALRSAIVEELWGTPKSSAHVKTTLDSYFTYYASQCEQYLANRGRNVSARTHADIIKVAKLISQQLSREDIVNKLKSCSRANLNDPENDESPLNGTINLTARLMSMCEVGRLQQYFSGQTSLSWDRGTLAEAIQGHFEAPKLDGHVRLEKLFNARNLERIGGLKIVWTDNLAEHLQLREDDCVVSVYHHATFLKNQQT